MGRKILSVVIIALAIRGIVVFIKSDIPAIQAKIKKPAEEPANPPTK